MPVTPRLVLVMNPFDSCFEPSWLRAAASMP
jgi:hypothetical protein